MLNKNDFIEKHIILVYAKEGQKITFLNDNIQIKDAEGQVILKVSCYKIFTLWIVGDTTISSGILQKSVKYAFSIVMFTYSFRPYGTWASPTEGNTLLRQKQYVYAPIVIAKHIVANKIHNQQALLKKIRKKEKYHKEAIAKLNKHKEESVVCNNLQSLLGIEGSASRTYFALYFQNMDWKGRKPRTKHDITNLLLDMGYTLLFHFVEAMLNLYGFDLYKGIYHQEFYQRKSLVCDLVEPFRPIIDHSIKKSFRLGKIHAEDFICQQERYQLSWQKSKPYTKTILESILKHKKEIFMYIQQYYRAFLREKSIEQYPFFDLSKKPSQ